MAQQRRADCLRLRRRTVGCPELPNAGGWNKADVAVTLAATDNLSGVAATEYNSDGAGWVAYTTGILIQAEGVHTVQYRSADKAGNVEPAQTLTVRVDKTAPEAYLQFDPLRPA